MKITTTVCLFIQIMRSRIIQLLPSLCFIHLAFMVRGQAQTSPTLTTLYNFQPLVDGANNNGASPAGGLLRSSDGNFYGVTQGGGTGATGTVFQVTPAGILTTLHCFGAPNSSNTTHNADGAYPGASLVQGSGGNFYGTTNIGGDAGAGTVFCITPTGTFTTIHSFSQRVAPGTYVNSDGDGPTGLVVGADGNLYGMAGAGGAYGNGTIFQITPAGTFTTLHSFGPTSDTGGASPDGAAPVGTLAQGNDGNFYGVTERGGKYGHGAIFRVTPAGALTILHSFSSLSEISSGTNADGASPDGLMLADDGNFYGVTFQGGTTGCGTAFRITPGGVLTTLHHFSATDDQGTNLDGAEPADTLIQASDGDFYGRTGAGGSSGRGTLFQMTPTGVLTTLHSFGNPDDNGFNTDGLLPSTLTQAADGSFYGSAGIGGTSGTGTVFRLTVALSSPQPVITSPVRDTAPLGLAYAYQITATAHPTAYSVAGLPPGLSIDRSSGLISGTPNLGGTFTVTLNASNGDQVGTMTLNLTVAPAVTLTATVPQVTVGTGEVGAFTLSLSAAQDHDVTVGITITGSAINGTDYQRLEATKTIKAGKVNKSIKIVPLNTELASGDKRVVTLVLAAGDGYALGTTGKVKVKILGQ